MYCCLTKLAWTDNYQIENGIAKHSSIAEFEKILLHKELLKLEAKFLIKVREINSNYLNYLNNNAMDDFKSMFDDWDEIKSDIKAASRLSKNVYN